MRVARSRIVGIVFAGIAATLALAPRAALAWWKDDWTLRNQITIDTSPNGAPITEPIGTAPVLLRLHSGNFKFEGAKDDGSDLRLIAGDDKTPLKYHIEKYDSLLGEAFVWVSLPDLKPGTKTDFWLYFGNKKANAGDDPKGTYDPDTVLVYHFGEKGAPPHDVTSWGNNAQNAGLPDSGSLIAGGLKLDGATTVTIPASQSLAWTDGAAMTWSAWVNMASAKPNAAIFSRRDGASGLRIGVDNGVPFVEVSNASGTQRSAAGAAMPAASWHHLAVVADNSITLYLDGKPYATLNSTLPALNAAAILGGDAAAGGAAPAGGFVGSIDEVEISKVARPAGFIQLAAINQGSGDLAGKLLKVGGDEETASFLSGYMAVILGSVTLDGWVVIGILMIMAVVSWVVMINKARYVNRLAKANNHFIPIFRQTAADLTLLDSGEDHEVVTMGGRLKAADRKALAHSNLYHLYHMGAQEIRLRFPQGGDGPRVLSPQAIAAIRATLDSGLVRENQKLNRLMVILTIAISGGPFLGLLGTVVGVMITFAAIAASGDVNVNAIAPGIAAALVATVAGLTVAIPALFGYNYLLSRIKEVSSDMQVFADEFVTKLAETYRGGVEQRPIAAE